MKAEKEKQSNLSMRSHFRDSCESHRTVLLRKQLADVRAPVLRGTLCLLEPRIPNNGLIIKYNHKSTQESSESTDCITSLIYTAQNPLCVSDGAIDGSASRGSGAGLGNVPMGTAFRSRWPEQKHLQGWMMSWVPFPKVSLLAFPPTLTL